VVEHTTHNRAVAGSIPASATIAGLVDASGLVPPGSRVLAAVSGGPDSTALLLALHELGRDVVGAHFDHALRPDSAADAEAVAALCKRLSVPLVTERRSGSLAPGSLQAAARAARYSFLERAADAHGRDLIAVAHTADDQAETVVMNLLRGSGPAGLRGMPDRRGRVVRPLLAATRAQVVEYLEQAGVTPREDPSNRDRRFLRARVRHLLMPRLDRPTLLAIAAAAQRFRDRVAAAASDSAREPALRMEALRRLYRAAGGADPGLTRGHLAAMDRLAQARRTGASLALPGHLVFRVLPDGMEIGPTRKPPAAAWRLRERRCSGCSDPAAAHLAAGELSLGHRSPGLRLQRPGGGTRKLQDLLVDAHVPRHLRDELPLVFLDGRLAWVPGVALDGLSTTRKSSPGRHVWVEGEGTGRW
jgi:tRNA(Ile)-lysidine synthase